MSKFTKAKKNKDKNLRKKKKEKSKRRRKEQEKSSDSDSPAPAPCIKKSDGRMISSLNLEFRKLKATASPQAIVRAKLKRDQRLLERDMKDLCKDVTKLFKTSNKEEEEEEEHFAEVENLSNVEDLIISNDNPEPGFHYTRWQQRKFLQKVRDKKIKYNYEDDQQT